MKGDVERKDCVDFYIGDTRGDVRGDVRGDMTWEVI